RGSCALRSLLSRRLTALTLRSLGLTPLSCRGFAALLLLLPLLLIALPLRSLGLTPLSCRWFAALLLLLPLLLIALGLRSLRLTRARAGRLATGLPLLVGAFARCSRLRLLAGLLPTLVGTLSPRCGLLTCGQSAAHCARRVIKEPALLAGPQRLQLRRPS